MKKTWGYGLIHTVSTWQWIGHNLRYGKIFNSLKAYLWVVHPNMSCMLFITTTLYYIWYLEVLSITWPKNCNRIHNVPNLAWGKPSNKKYLTFSLLVYDFCTYFCLLDLFHIKLLFSCQPMDCSTINKFRNTPKNSERLLEVKVKAVKRMGI